MRNGDGRVGWGMEVVGRGVGEFREGGGGRGIE